MIIKKYRADDIAEAKKIVAEELGPDALILTSREVKEKGLKGLFSSVKVEITAAIEEEELKAHQKRKQALRPEKKESLKSEKREELSQEHLNETLHEMQEMLEQQEKKGVLPPTTTESITYGDPRKKKTVSSSQPTPAPSSRNVTDQISISRQARALGTVPVQEKTEEQKTIAAKAEEKATKISSPATRNQQGKDLGNLVELSQKLVHQFGHTQEEKKTTTARRGIATPNEKPKEKVRTAPVSVSMEDSQSDQLRRLIREEMQRAQRSVAADEFKGGIEESVVSVRFLASKGVSHALSVEIEESLRKKLGIKEVDITGAARHEHLNALKRELTSYVSTTGPILLRKGEPTIVALVGPTGVGKTSTAMKLAAQYAQKLDKKVAVITLDPNQTVKSVDAQALSKTLNVPFIQIEDLDDTAGVIQGFHDYDLILVDTRGRSQYLVQEIDELADLLSTIEGVQTHLVISATTKDVDVYGTIQQFAPLGFESVIFTKLDETIAQGILVNVCHKTQYPISYITTGQDLFKDIKIADGQDIARRVLMHNNNAEFQKLRRFAGV